MDFLGIGPLELIFVFIIILIVLGPQDMVKVGGTLGRYIRQIMRSDTWRVIQDTSREIRGLPTKLARQAGLEEFEKEMREGMEFPKIGDIPKKVEEGIKEELQFDSWTNPAGLIPEEKEPSSDLAQPAEKSHPGDSSNPEENPETKEEPSRKELPAANPSPSEIDPSAEE